nr:unnamed protein product [Digitaria exilis]
MQKLSSLLSARNQGWWTISPNSSIGNGISSLDLRHHRSMTLGEAPVAVGTIGAVQTELRSHACTPSFVALAPILPGEPVNTAAGTVAVVVITAELAAAANTVVHSAKADATWRCCLCICYHLALPSTSIAADSPFAGDVGPKPPASTSSMAEAQLPRLSSRVAPPVDPTCSAPYSNGQTVCLVACYHPTSKQLLFELQCSRSITDGVIWVDPILEDASQISNVPTHTPVKGGLAPYSSDQIVFLVACHQPTVEQLPFELQCSRSITDGVIWVDPMLEDASQISNAPTCTPDKGSPAPTTPAPACTIQVADLLTPSKGRGFMPGCRFLLDSNISNQAIQPTAHYRGRNGGNCSLPGRSHTLLKISAKQQHSGQRTGDLLSCIEATAKPASKWKGEIVAMKKLGLLDGKEANTDEARHEYSCFFAEIIDQEGCLTRSLSMLRWLDSSGTSSPSHLGVFDSLS